MIVLVIRTRRLFLKSKPGRALTWVTLMVTGATLVLPFTPLGALFGFHTLPYCFFPLLAVVVGVYVFSVEAAKRIFYRKIHS